MEILQSSTKQSSHWYVNARQWYRHCISNGDTTVLHLVSVISLNHFFLRKPCIYMDWVFYMECPTLCYVHECLVKCAVNEIKSLIFIRHYSMIFPHITLYTYHQTSSISHTKSNNLNVSSCSCLCTIYWNQVLSWEWWCSSSSADRQCPNYIWVINKFFALLW